MNNTHYHLLKPSPWPLSISLSSWIAAIGFISWNHNYQGGGLIGLIGLACNLLILTVWMSDTWSETLYLGAHSLLSKKASMVGFIVFMISETFFFSTFIWSFFYFGLSPNVFLGSLWPPFPGIYPWSLPLFNTVLLLSSGVTLTWAHNGLLSLSSKDVLIGLIWTIMLGSLFCFFQVLEYVHSPFTLSDSVFGSVFFSTLSLHGSHLWAGIVLLVICFTSLVHYQMSAHTPLSFEFALIFYHLVDAIWIVLFLFYYLWCA